MVDKQKAGVILSVIMVVLVWAIFIYLAISWYYTSQDLKACESNEASTCYMLTCATGTTATCDNFALRCDDVELGKARCSNNPTVLVDVNSADGDLCTGNNFTVCKTTIV